ncbi:MAG: tetraacyldisaccharide 4'-kinase [Bacteroidales bacterium]|nr:tetraacyldisaccharide 4'-kinase [Bacteroidales bacterium]
MLYGTLLAIRHFFYDKGWKKSQEASVPTVCIGNITVGGTGKTPHTEMVLRRLLKSDDWAYSNLAVLSRGYKRKSKGFQLVPRDGTALLYGDEPLQIAKKFPSVTVAVDKNRIRGCEQLKDAHLIVLDEAFQYRKLRASLNIVLVDYNRPVHKDSLLPWGRLRDLKSRMKAADIVIVTKCPAYLDDWERSQWVKYLRLTPEQKLFFTTFTYGAMEPVFPEGDARYTYSKRLVLFTGIANDAPLRSFLSDTYKIVRRIGFPDHHKYTRADIGTLSSAVKEFPTACLVTTEKDAQRIVDAKKVPDELRLRMFQIPVEASFLTPEEDAAFTETLLQKLKK